jgi:Ferredoxin thioredoxin reductase variable alpha chain
VVRASDGHSTGKFQEGQRVKVTTPVKIFHAPKAPKEGIQLEGLEGTVVKDVTHFKGKILSANFPYKVEFVLDINGAKSKFQTHLVSALWHDASRPVAACIEQMPASTVT